MVRRDAGAGSRTLPLEDYVAGVRANDRTILARAITLVESERDDDRRLADALLRELVIDTGGSCRIAISGVPGAGKSTFIDALGTHLTGAGRRVAVLAVDPSSAVSGGSVLGDKTRMPRLARDESAFIRPSPTSGSLGGVARKTAEAMMLCEAAGHDVVIVETVGVGQSEMVVADMVDFFVLLLIAGAGDELQGIKRGIVEVADLLAVNKADGDNVAAAERARKDYTMALRLVRGGPGETAPDVVTCSAREDRGIAELWARVEERIGAMRDSGVLERRRSGQRVRWMWRIVEDRLLHELRAHPEVRTRAASLERHVREGAVPPAAAAAEILGLFRR